jgi:transcription termination factor NusB
MPDEKTYGQKLVGLDFNHAEGETHDAVHEAKQHCADLIDMVNDRRNPNDSHIKNTLSTFAVTTMLAAQMAVVKVLTWKD